MTGEILRSVSFDAWTAAAAGIMERIDRLAALEAEMIAMGAECVGSFAKHKFVHLSMR